MNLKKILETTAVEFHSSDQVKINGKNMNMREFLKRAKNDSEYNKVLFEIKKLWQEEKRLKGYTGNMMKFIKHFFSMKDNKKMDILIRNGVSLGNKKRTKAPDIDKEEFDNGRNISVKIGNYNNKKKPIKLGSPKEEVKRRK
jgi:hypothetical protein